MHLTVQKLLGQLADQTLAHNHSWLFHHIIPQCNFKSRPVPTQVHSCLHEIFDCGQIADQSIDLHPNAVQQTLNNEILAAYTNSSFWPLYILRRGKVSFRYFFHQPKRQWIIYMGPINFWSFDLPTVIILCVLPTLPRFPYSSLQPMTTLNRLCRCCPATCRECWRPVVLQWEVRAIRGVPPFRTEQLQG